METKHIYIILVVVVVLFAGFLGFRHFSKTQGAQVHQEETFNRLTQVAKESARGGLSQMGKALKRYYQANKTYPATLDALYPKYIAGKSFIQDIKWDYRPMVDNFYLGKTINRKGREFTAATDASLKTRMESGGAMVAKKSKPAVKSRSRQSSAKDSMDRSKILAELKTTNSTPSKAAEKEEITAFRAVPRVVIADETEPPAGFSWIARNDYLVWKFPDGHMGIGNVQYPNVDQIDIATQEKWFKVKKLPMGDTASGAIAGGNSKEKIVNDFLTRLTQGKHLAWKDKNGTVCFGNVQYPESGDVSAIYMDGKWLAVDKINPL